MSYYCLEFCTYTCQIILSIKISICNKTTYISTVKFSFLSSVINELKGKDHSISSSAAMLSVISGWQEKRCVLGVCKPALNLKMITLQTSMLSNSNVGCVKTLSPGLGFRYLKTFTVGLCFSTWSREAFWTSEKEWKLVLLCTCNLTLLCQIGW